MQRQTSPEPVLIGSHIYQLKKKCSPIGPSFDIICALIIQSIFPNYRLTKFPAEQHVCDFMHRRKYWYVTIDRVWNKIPFAYIKYFLLHRSRSEFVSVWGPWKIGDMAEAIGGGSMLKTSSRTLGQAWIYSHMNQLKKSLFFSDLCLSSPSCANQIQTKKKK